MSNDHEWLNLVEVSGPFLAVPVLKDVFPQGLEALSSGHPQRLRRTYEEWREAVDIQDVDLTELHAAWVKEVLSTSLEIDDAVLRSGDTLPASLTMMMPEHGTTITPDMAVVNPTNDDEPLLLVHVYAPDTNLEATHRFDGLAITPADRMVSLLRATGCPIGLVTNGERWMLVHAPVGAVAGFASWYARLWGQEPETLRAFVSLLGVRRFFGPDDGRLTALFERSLKHQDDVTEALGEQVRRAVEVLVQSLDRANQDRNQELLRDVDPRELYEASLTVMMRLVFLLAAEERGLLLLGDPRYDSFYAISSLRMQLRSVSEEILERRRSAWSRLLGLFRGVFGGIEHPTLRLPALGGSLFDPDRYPFLEGRKKGTFWRTDPAEPLPIDDRTVLLLLEAIQTFQGRALSYRALDVEQIGHVYEGLLERTVKRVDDVTLELDGGSKAKSPRITLGEMESARLDGTTRVVELLKERSERSESAIRNALERQVDDRLAARLLTVCRGDVALRDRILPLADLLRTDPWGYPLVHQKGAFVVVLGSDRHESGTHYTPKSLTEKIVEETLTPVAYLGPAEGKTPKEWELRSTEDLLDLKICDPAMGSGAFLVQACRWLSDRLVEAWSVTEAKGMRVDSEGRIIGDASCEGFEPLSPDIEERSIVARRLVAERCLYGVDKNPLAVELAKLSLWLTTMSKGRPFGFLDHNLRSGDSLLGVHDIRQLIELDMAPKGSSQLRLFGRNIQSAVDEAVSLRMRLRAIPIRDIGDVDAIAALDAESRSALKLPKLIADELVKTSIRFSKNARSLRAELTKLAVKADEIFINRNAPGVAIKEEDFFHWPIEFPEVFERDTQGFDAVIGNPPYVNAVVLSEAENSANIKKFFSTNFASATGSYDLYVLFFERALHICATSGLVGFIVPNKILSAEYAESLRRIFVTKSEIQSISDYSSIRVFSASVYPIVLVLRMARTGVDAFVETVQKSPRKAVGQAAFANAPSFLWGFILSDFSEIVENALTETTQLCKCASVSGAATVSEAYEIIPAIEEIGDREIPPNFCKFIVSGNIRPFRSTWGMAPVQYLKTRYKKPIANLKQIPKKRQEQALKPKIIISGMAKRPVAFLDFRGEYLSGKSTVIILDPKNGASLRSLTAILNSKLGALIYFGLYSGLALSGGYLRFGPPQISAFPIPAKLDLQMPDDISLLDLEVLVCKAYSVDCKAVEMAFAKHFGEESNQDDATSDNEEHEG
ncbi:Eco57I restriction-modification methylase domain-containing protein [Oceaniglobus ichthyenteri]|uniref:Eco57I restriction-modification methylase domain-containing protein n=1 Tax=Oceaniglobus ichthyenteri TaxID=2136177 RepID=UPI000D3BA93B|nr:N-6 DNA methylase [Oceaniglobus ichthyenteri]